MKDGNASISKSPKVFVFVLNCVFYFVSCRCRWVWDSKFKTREGTNSGGNRHCENWYNFVDDKESNAQVKWEIWEIFTVVLLFKLYSVLVFLVLLPHDFFVFLVLIWCIHYVRQKIKLNLEISILALMDFKTFFRLSLVRIFHLL